MTNEMLLKTRVASIHNAHSMYLRMLKLMDILERVGTISKSNLRELMEYNIDTMMDYLIAFGKVEKEIRKEEFIEVTDSKWTYFDENGNEIPKTVKVIVGGKEYEVDNPELFGENKSKYTSRWAEKTLKVQVKRMYYKWVG